MKKEIIWNVSLLLFGVFIGLLIGYKIQSSMIIGWDLNRVAFGGQSLFVPLILVYKWLFGLILGVILIVFRYIQKAILSIKHADFKLLVLLVSYFLPILFCLIWLDFHNTAFLSELSSRIAPTNAIQLTVSELREDGFFKKYAAEDDSLITDLAIGRLSRSLNGEMNSSVLFNSQQLISNQAIMKLDYDKTLRNNDIDLTIEGNRTYEKVLKKLAIISEGHIKLDSVNEQWLSKNEIRLMFQINSKTHEIFPTVHGDYTDTKTVLSCRNFFCYKYFIFNVL